MRAPALTLAIALALGLLAPVLLAAGCAREVPGTNLCMPRGPDCSDVPTICDPSSSGTGAVVVRWRVADVALGRLLGRGQCCCNPDFLPGGLAREQCSSSGAACLDSPAWLLRNVQLRVTRADAPAESCTFSAACADGELTTPPCLLAGEYDLQLVGDVEGFVSPAPNQPLDRTEFRCLERPAALTPPAVRRHVRTGQTVNLDGIVLGVNAR